MSKHHELLGVSPGASQEELKKAHRKKMREWHPDRFAADSNFQQRAKDKLQEINHAYDELSKAAGKSPAPSPAPSAFKQEPAPPRSQVGIWPILAALVALAALLIFLGSQSGSARRASDPKMFSQDSGSLHENGMHRYSLNSASGKELYILEGPRPPLDWEVDALVSAYTDRNPRTKESVGNFSISQTLKPGDKQLVPLRYRVGDER